MTPILTALVLLAAPITPDAACENTWAKAKAPANAETLRCARHFLQYGYGGKWTSESLSFDPQYTHAIEKRYQTADLQRMIGHVKAACTPAADGADLCGRTLELFGAWVGRKTTLFEDVNLGSMQPVLEKVLAGKALTRDDLHADHPEMNWSALTLSKLRNAAYARHGYQFKNPDLNAFFYGPRAKREGSLPLPKGTTKTVKLTPIDGANVRLIKSLEGK